MDLYKDRIYKCQDELSIMIEVADALYETGEHDLSRLIGSWIPEDEKLLFQDKSFLKSPESKTS